jgi:type II secretory pathway predicted ATPase ExeA
VPELALKNLWDSDKSPKAVETKLTEENYMSRPILMQATRRVLNLKAYESPFENDILDTKDVFWGMEQLVAREHIRNAAMNSGFIALVSEPGGGKSTVANDLEQFSIDNDLNMRFIRPDNVLVDRITASTIYDAIITDLGGSTVHIKRGLENKSRQAKELLSRTVKDGNRCILVIEDAQDLTFQTLKALKRFWEIKHGHRPLLGIVLIGQTELAEKLDEKKHWNTREVVLRCQVVHIPPYSVEDIKKYLELKFKRISVDINQFFAPDCYDAIAARLLQHTKDSHQSFAYPQRINNLVIMILNKFAQLGGNQKITAELIMGDLNPLFEAY